ESERLSYQLFDDDRLTAEIEGNRMPARLDCAAIALVLAYCAHEGDGFILPLKGTTVADRHRASHATTTAPRAVCRARTGPRETSSRIRQRARRDEEPLHRWSRRARTPCALLSALHPGGDAPLGSSSSSSSGSTTTATTTTTTKVRHTD
ncbi:unnamed protein product, partial [Scytosiphon promiscuus]